MLSDNVRFISMGQTVQVVTSKGKFDLTYCTSKEIAEELVNELNKVIDSFYTVTRQINEKASKKSIGINFISELSNVVKETTGNTAKFFKSDAKQETIEETKQIVSIKPYKRRMADGRVVDVKAGKREQIIKIKK
ncbi:hypothetical protein [Ruminiclostridium cellobioparum]|uniref:hypothetical protein n=1 Tax=Ruminiclostridium cellobioparum TaxID=29355 RepID=UPI0028ADF98E|nr:hypothetical protein [Ruminiclostridium cellobioparum]